MTAFPDDIMRAAREAVITAAPQMDRASAERIRAGAMDNSHATTIIARAILAERQRCVDVVNAERVMDADENPSDADPTDIAYDMAIDHAIDAIKRLSA